ncbi:glycosyl hydrolase family 8 [Halodurantibacterium flavum]|uniref:cellulase n=1 Tax=Halodurantibacterium flavum TaxID=1382802 RepID=A0ABW4S651_9RHOB
MALLALPLLGTPSMAQSAVDRQEVWQAAWEDWKTDFLRPDGRVVDEFQSDASHSEGQGYGMVLATEFGDAESFRLMNDWAQSQLAIRQDALMAWRWFPRRFEAVPDLNTASDGDLFRAWGLVRAATRFGEPRYLETAQRIAQHLLWICVAEDPRRPDDLVLLPGAEGFRKPDAVTVNPSYYMPLAMREIAQATGLSEFRRLAADGEALLAEAAQARMAPDWVDVTRAGLRDPERLSYASGYDALRVPLFLIWSGRASHAAVHSAARVYRESGGGTHAPTVVEPNGHVRETSSHGGYRAIQSLVTCAGNGGGIPRYERGQGYFPSTLHLMSYVAWRSTSGNCLT